MCCVLKIRRDNNSFELKNKADFTAGDDFMKH
jgi:hypothetical protein